MGGAWLVCFRQRLAGILWNTAVYMKRKEEVESFDKVRLQGPGSKKKKKSTAFLSQAEAYSSQKKSVSFGPAGQP